MLTLPNYTLSFTRTFVFHYIYLVVKLELEISHSKSLNQTYCVELEMLDFWLLVGKPTGEPLCNYPVVVEASQSV